MIDCCNSTPKSKTGNQSQSQLVTGNKHLDLQREILLFFWLAHYHPKIQIRTGNLT
jgi:hypothetical protein